MFLFEIRLSYYDLILINAAIGFIFGLIPLIISFFKKKIKLGIFGILSSTFSGAVLGLFLSVPVTILFVWLIVKKKTVSENGTNSPENPEND